MARAPANTSRVFQRKETEPRALTSERIADHLAAFHASGGHIEVLGSTRVLKKLDDLVTTPLSAPDPVRSRTK